jgi:hypothetical protein
LDDPQQGDTVRCRNTSRIEERRGKKLKRKEVGTKKIMVIDPCKMESMVGEEKHVI